MRAAKVAAMAAVAAMEALEAGQVEAEVLQVSDLRLLAKGLAVMAAATGLAVVVVVLAVTGLVAVMAAVANCCVRHACLSRQLALIHGTARHLVFSGIAGVTDCSPLIAHLVALRGCTA